MKKILVLLCLSLLFPCVTNAQRELTYKDETPENAVFAGNDNEAGVIITCPDNLDLRFSSTMDAQVNTYRKEEADNMRKYYINFPTGRRYRGRALEIMAPGFKKLTIVIELEPKQRKDFYIYDPNGTIGVGCYEGFRNEAVGLYRNGFYEDAKAKYLLSKECSDCPDQIEVHERIAAIDSILQYKQDAELNFAMLNFKEAIELYKKIMFLNPDDDQAKSRIADITRSFDALCNEYYINAERLYYNGDYEDAFPLYSKIVSQNCANIGEAANRIAEIERRRTAKAQRYHVLTYEYLKNTPIGFSTGNYKNNKTSGYFTLRLNADIFDMIRSDKENAEKPEVNVSFGWTRRLFNPVWIFFGPGYALQMAYEKDEDGELTDSLELFHSITPEIGLLGKIGPVVLRYTFQYRFALSTDYEDRFNKLNHIIGVGICF